MTSDRGYDSGPFFTSIDTVLIGRRSYEVMLRQGVRSYPVLKTFVYSRTLKSSDYPELMIVADDGVAVATRLRDAIGKDIWLSGGGELFRTLLAADLVDTVEVGVSPILLGQGRSFLPAPGRRQKLRLTSEHAYPSGLLILHYDVF